MGWKKREGIGVEENVVGMLMGMCGGLGIGVVRRFGGL